MLSPSSPNYDNVEAMAYQYKREPLTPDEADRLVNAAENTDEKLCVWGLIETGLRVSELAALTAPNIQWQQRRVRVMGKGGPYGKRSKYRIVPLSDRLRRLFEPYFILHECFPLGTRQIQRTVTRVANRAGIARPCSPHVLRHTFAVLAVQRGVSTRSLQQILGHDHLSTTEIYLNMSPEETLREFHAKW